MGDKVEISDLTPFIATAINTLRELMSARPENKVLATLQETVSDFNNHNQDTRMNSVALFKLMIMYKMARLKQGHDPLDSSLDIAGYGILLHAYLLFLDSKNELVAEESDKGHTRCDQEDS